MGAKTICNPFNASPFKCFFYNRAFLDATKEDDAIFSSTVKDRVG
jgi:hypothetical protein